MQSTSEPLRLRSWSYVQAGDDLQVRVHMHLTAAEQVVSIIEEYLYAQRFFSIISTDIRALNATRFSYYRSLEQSGGLIFHRLKLKEIIHETTQQIHSARSQARHYDLHRPAQAPRQNILAREQFGELEQIEAQLRQQHTPALRQEQTQAWSGQLSQAQYNASGQLIDGEFTLAQTTTTSASSSLPRSTDLLESAQEPAQFPASLQLSLIADAQGNSSVWIESLNHFPIMAKLIRRFIHFDEVDLMLRRGHKRIHQIRRALDQGHESETFFFPLPGAGGIDVR